MLSKEKMIDSRDFRDVMGRFATGVTIVTVMEESIPHGMTVNSFTSVSLDPALILICLDKEATTTAMLVRTGRFSVNILHENQKDLAKLFADNDNERSRFDEIDYKISEEGTPLLRDVMGNLTCLVKETIEGGDHLIFVGEVVSLDYAEDNLKPLLFYRGNFKSLDVDGQIREKG